MASYIDPNSPSDTRQRIPFWKLNVNGQLVGAHGPRERTQISIEDAEGKGVSGILADVRVSPGGLPFSLIVTHDGQPPTPVRTLHHTTTIGGTRLDRPETSPNAFEHGAEGASPSEGDEARTETLTAKVDQLLRDNAALARDRDVAQRTADDRGRGLERAYRELDQVRAALRKRMRELSEVVRARDEWKVNCHNWEAKVQALEDLNRSPSVLVFEGQVWINDTQTPIKLKCEHDEDEIQWMRERIDTLESGTITAQATTIPGVLRTSLREKPRLRVMTFHEVDGAVSIRVEPMEA